MVPAEDAQEIGGERAKQKRVHRQRGDEDDREPAPRPRREDGDAHCRSASTGPKTSGSMTSVLLLASSTGATSLRSATLPRPAATTNHRRRGDPARRARPPGQTRERRRAQPLDGAGRFDRGIDLVAGEREARSHCRGIVEIGANAAVGERRGADAVGRGLVGPGRQCGAVAVDRGHRLAAKIGRIVGHVFPPSPFPPSAMSSARSFRRARARSDS